MSNSFFDFKETSWGVKQPCGAKQRFKKGNLVEVVYLSSSMSHFNRVKRGIINEVSHNNCQKGNGSEWSYGLDILNE
jgi:hypothetical protein